MASAPQSATIPQAPLPFGIKILAYVISPLLAALSLYLIGAIGHEASAGDAAKISALVGPALAAIIAFVFSALIAVNHISEHRATNKAVVRESGLQRRVRYHEEMLRLITDNIPNVLFIADRDGRFWFANRETADQAGTNTTDIVGRTLDRVMPARKSGLLLDRIRRAQNAQAPVITVDKHDGAGGPHYLQTYHIPLPDTSELHRTVLVTQKDVTDVIVERERQEQIFKQLVDTLIAVVDRRDPYAAGHSIRVGALAHALATEMDLDPQSVDAATIAGSLMNLGKILVPRSILIKAGALNAEELRLVRKSILTSADILSLISFEVPVIPTLRQVLERYDGQGEPDHRKGENILLTARIVAVANAFVALVSPRAHRAGLDLDAAMGSLKTEADKAYDAKVIEALARYLQKNPQERDGLVKAPPELKSIPLDKDLLGD